MSLVLYTQNIFVSIFLLLLQKIEYKNRKRTIQSTVCQPTWPEIATGTCGGGDCYIGTEHMRKPKKASRSSSWKNCTHNLELDDGQ